MEGDVGVAQEVIKLLATEDGLCFIKDVAERHLAVATSTTVSMSFWNFKIRALFVLISHPKVIESAVLEQEVATVFKYLLGVGGARMAKLFGYVIRLLQDWPAETSYESRMAAVELHLAVLSKALDCNTVNVINDKFPALVNAFSECIRETSRPNDDFSLLQANKYIEHMRRRLEVGAEMAQGPAVTQVSVPREQFVLRRDLPGHLSAEGPRHDNDHADIANIQILPTYEEVMSLRREYLLTTDSAQ